MKRNRFGINVDEGLALTTSEEFELLFVDTDSDAKKRLQEWLKYDDKPILFGGQIGCGKTTLIEYVFNDSDTKPDITFHFDKNSLNLSSTDSWAIVFTELFRYFASNGLTDVEIIPAEYKDLLGDTPAAWHESLSQIRLESFSQSAIDKNKDFNNLLESTLGLLGNFFTSLIKKIETLKKSSVVLFASGVDKFEPKTTAYFALTDIFQALVAHKTLFEVNAVHLFSDEQWMRKLERIVVPVSDIEQVTVMLKKRLGDYADAYTEEISLIAEYSGGIPRQGLRLLDSFLALQKQKPNKSQAFFQAVENVNRDFFAFSQRPENALVQSVNKTKLLETTLISLPGDIETAQRAVFGNWFLLKRHVDESRWEAILNPLIKESLIDDITPEEPERALLKEYARQTGISETGLEFDITQAGWQDTLLDQLEKPIELNVTEILDGISSALLSKQRADRIIVAFENKVVANAVRKYLEAKSNTYEYQVWSHEIIEESAETSPLVKMLQCFSEKPVDVHSFEFEGQFSQYALDELNLRRDSFFDKQLLWWIPKQELRRYLERWTQLRQFFQIYVLDEDLAKSLSIEEIESDLDFMSDLVESDETASSSYVENLKIVLNYLKEVTHG